MGLGRNATQRPGESSALAATRIRPYLNGNSGWDTRRVTDLLERLKKALTDRYAIERELGSGGMAVVFLATDKKLGREVALKVLRPELAASLGAERFLREIEIAAKLTHPNILALYD
jgi:serine/threonine protein kinase